MNDGDDADDTETFARKECVSGGSQANVDDATDTGERT